MAYQVNFNIPSRVLGKADIEFSVSKDDKKFGTLKVSKGAIEWVPKDMTYGYVMDWVNFDSTIKKNGKKNK